MFTTRTCSKTRPNVQIFCGAELQLEGVVYLAHPPARPSFGPQAKTRRGFLVHRGPQEFPLIPDFSPSRLDSFQVEENGSAYFRGQVWHFIR